MFPMVDWLGCGSEDHAVDGLNPGICIIGSPRQCKITPRPKGNSSHTRSMSGSVGIKSIPTLAKVNG